MTETGRDAVMFLRNQANNGWNFSWQQIEALLAVVEAAQEFIDTMSREAAIALSDELAALHSQASDDSGERE